MPQRKLQFDDAKSQKFWTIKLTGSSHTVNFGRIGTSGQSRTKEFASKQEAKSSYDKLIEQKLAKGYTDAKTGTASVKKSIKKKVTPTTKKKTAKKKGSKVAVKKPGVQNKRSDAKQLRNSVDENSSPAAKRQLMTKRRYFENDAGQFWEIRLMAMHQQTWEGNSGERASRGNHVVYPTRATAETEYFALVRNYIGQGYREMKKPLLKKRTRPARRKKPQTSQEPVNDALLGLVRYDSLTKRWEGSLEINGVMVSISFSQLDTELEPAKNMAKLLKRRIKSITKSVARDVHPHIYDDIDPTPTVTELTKCLQLSGVSFSNRAGAECFFGTQEIFGDHEVVVWVEPDGTVGEGHLAG